jgi:pimeloyl-ACP methyl ester carboxylesterase
MTGESGVGRLDRGDGVALAWQRLAGSGPALLFLPGFGSDMEGEKARFLADWCARQGRALLRFDYSGHGASGGAFTDGTIGRWLDDTLAVMDRLTEGPVVLVGSSMGGWIAVLAALARRARVVGLVGIAAAPDFTERLMWQAMLPAERAALLFQGRLEVPSRYGPPGVITSALIEDGRTRLVLEGPIALDIPVRLVHGQRDADVPWEMALLLAGRLESADVRTVLIKDGEHRLSRAGDLAAIAEIVGGMFTAG